MFFGIARRLVEPDRFVFLDESGARTDMTRLHGRSRGGERCIDFASGGQWKTYTMLAAIRTSGVVKDASLVGPGAMNGELFLEWVRTRLCPTLSPGDVVVMDNLGSHKVAGVEDAVEAAGAAVWYLPPYSPDLNPIEKAWSKVKASLRRAGARSEQGLYAAVGAALDGVTPENCMAFMRSCGYST